MNIKKVVYSLFFLISCNSLTAYAAKSAEDMTAYELLRARQMCERSYPRLVCLEMEQTRYKELQEQRIREESKARHHERDRDDRSEDQRRDREDAEIRALKCRYHPETCESRHEEIDERMTQQQWCERYYSRAQCLEMYREAQWQRRHNPPEPPISQHRPRVETSREQQRSRDLERSETPPARIIERRDNRLQENDVPRDPSRRNSETRESGR